MKMYIGKINWYNDAFGKEEICNFFCAAESYPDAMERCMDRFGECETMAITLEEFTDSGFVEFWGDEEANVFDEAKAVAVEHAMW